MNLFKPLCVSLAFLTMSTTVAFGQPKQVKISRATGCSAIELNDRKSPITPRPLSSFATSPVTRAPQTATKAQSQSTAEAPTIYGSMLLSQKWNLEDAVYGIYSFPATENTTFTLETDSFLTNANGGGTYANSRYYMYYWFEASGVVFTYFRIFDTDTWTAIYSERTSDYYVATDMTFDRTTENIYGCFYSFTTGGYYFGTANPANGAVTVLGAYNEPLFTLAADVNGDLYGISADGRLNRVDKTNGKLTPIGFTGLTPAYTQSMAFDLKTNRLYWPAVTASVNGLYEVDITTGKASVISAFDYKEEFAGVFIKNDGAAAAAPGELTDFSAEYDINTDTDIKVAFTLPATSFGGTVLSGQLDWTIRVNDVDIDMGSGAPGAKVNYTVKGTPAGYTVVTAFASNASGNGPESRERKWIGRDNPEAVKNLTANVNGGDVTISWSAPTESEHGGYFDPSNLSYRVTRQPGNTIIANSTSATSVTDHIDTSILTSYYYEVTAYAAGLSSPTASTAKVLVGDAFTPPYSENFSNATNFELYTIIDANHDGKTWTYENGAVRGAYSFTSNMDDWLISPPITLSTENLYQVCIAARTFGYTERFEVCLGKAATPEAMTEVVIAPTSFQVSSYTEYKGDIIPPTDGIYYIGIHQISDKERNTLYVNKVELTKLSSITAPAPVSNFKVTPGDKGALTATISMQLPTTSISGKTLTELTSAKLYKGNRIMKNFTDIKPGQILSHTDNACSKGFNEYRVVVSNSEGDGRDATASAFVGPDVPAGAVNIRLAEVNGKAHLTWDAPSEGVNGGYIDPASLKYHVSAQDFVNGGTKVMAQNLSSCEYWDTPTISGQQGMAAYYVYAVNAEGVGYGYRSNVLVMGTPYVLPFSESFSNEALRYSTWRFENSVGDNNWGISSGGTYPSCAPADNDGGLMTFQPMIEGAVSMITSGLIDVSGTESPVFEFYYFNNRLSTDKITALASQNGYEFDDLKTVQMSPVATNGWIKVSAPLDKYKQCKRLQVGIRIEAGNDLANVHFDKIVVRDLPERDLAVTAFSAPSTMALGVAATINVTVTNMGITEAASYRVALIRNGQEVDSQTGEALAADASKSFRFSQTPDRSFGDKSEFSARVYFDGDTHSENDAWPAEVIFITQPPYPTVSDLSGSLDASGGSVTLSWSAPDIESGARVIDSFESYSAFSINNIGDWMTLDGDHEYTVFISNTDMWPNAGEPQAFIVFNAEQAGLDEDYNDGTASMFLAHEGKQMLISFAGEEAANDDWLISPRLSGKEQEITFWLKSLTDYYGAEKWEFLTSTGQFRENTADFVKMTEGQATESWKKVSVTVPAGTNFFAIRCTSDQAFGLCIDDINYTPEALDVKLAGYHVYCNHKCLTEKPITATTYVHNGVDPDGSYIYHVVCVYDKGESAYSNAVNFGAASISDTAAGTLRLTTSPGMLHIAGAEGEAYQIAAVDGHVVASGTAADRTSLPLQAGVYVVSVGESHHKILIR